MIKIKENPLEALLKKGINMAKTHGEDQIVSITEKINKVDPIQFYEAAKQTKKNRLFWTSHSQDLVIVGIGNSYEMIAHTSRFEKMEKLWKSLLGHAIIHNPYKVPGTGILALGGMSFDPRKETSNLWKQFRPSQMIVPEYTLTKYKNKYYFTTTIKVNKENESFEMIRNIEDIKFNLLQDPKPLPSAAYAIDKKEINSNKWMESVKQAIKEINENKAKKIVLARKIRLQLNKNAEIAVILNKLLKTQTNSYIFAFEQNEECFIGATPERLVKVNENKLLSTCLAGTAPRGRSEQEDMEIAKQLLSDKKNLEEHFYVVHMIKNKIGKYCTNINVPDQPVVYPLKNLQHLYTPVSAEIKREYSIFNIIKELHPTPALGGVPRNEALTFIRKHELLDRGWYGAPIGWVDSNKNSEFAVAIRSGLIQNDEVSLFAGCGVMKDSDPLVEYKETDIKFAPMLSVLEDSNNYELR